MCDHNELMVATVLTVKTKTTEQSEQVFVLWLQWVPWWPHAATIIVFESHCPKRWVLNKWTNNSIRNWNSTFLRGVQQPLLPLATVGVAVLCTSPRDSSSPSLSRQLCCNWFLHNVIPVFLFWVPVADVCKCADFGASFSLEKKSFYTKQNGKGRELECRFMKWWVKFCWKVLTEYSLCGWTCSIKEREK